MGFGDEIMVTGEVSRLRTIDKNTKIVIGDGEKEFWSPIFEGNPDINRLSALKSSDKILWLKNYEGNRPYLDYRSCDPQMGYRQGFREYQPIPGKLYLPSKLRNKSRTVVSRFKTTKPLLFIEPNTAFGSNKQWGTHKWSALAKILKKQYFLIQPVYGGAALLPFVHPIYSESFLFGCALLEQCDFFVGVEGGLHHAAAALGKKAVVIFGGRISPKTTGYDFHSNLYVEDGISPCGMIAPCVHCRRCMEKIMVEEVLNAIQKRFQ